MEKYTESGTVNSAGKENLPFFILLCIAVVPGLFFFFLRGPGFGADSDAWRIVYSGLRLVQKGEWVPSRFPGNPLAELLSAAFSGSAFLPYAEFLLPFVFFLFVCGGVAVVLLYLRERGRNGAVYFAAVSVAIWSVPVVAVNAGTTMDYSPGIFFFLSAFYYSQKGSVLIAALCAGLAIVTRLQYVLLIPALVYHLRYYYPETFKVSSVRFLLVVFFVTCAGYGYYYAQYGLELFLFTKPPYPPLKDVIGRATIKVWGIGGSLFVALLCTVLYTKRKKLNPMAPVKVFVLGTAGAVLFYLRYPYEGGYLAVAVFLFIMFVAMQYGAKQMTVIALVFLLSSFAGDVHHRIFTLSGPVINNREERRQDKEIVAAFLTKSAGEKQKIVIVCEAYLPKIKVTALLNNTPIPANVVPVYGTGKEITALINDKTPFITFQEYMGLLP